MYLVVLTYGQNDERMIMKTFKEAIETLDPQKVENGKLSDIWLQYGKYYKSKGDYQACNQVLQKGTLVYYRTIDEFINLWS